MAALSFTTPGTCRAVSASTRRKLVGGSLLAALSGAAFAVAVLLPDRDDKIAADITPSADAGLLELCAACDALTHQAEMFSQGPTRIADEKARNLALMRIDERQVPLLKQLCKICPATVYGHAMRARTLLLWDKDPCWTRPASLDEALAAAVVHDLARGA